MLRKNGEGLFILLFLAVAIILSTWFSWQDSIHSTSIAYKVRAEVSYAISEFEREDAFEICKQEAEKRKDQVDLAVVWYDDGVTYWCGTLYFDELTQERVEELRDHIIVLNTRDGHLAAPP